MNFLQILIVFVILLASCERTGPTGNEPDVETLKAPTSFQGSGALLNLEWGDSVETTKRKVESWGGTLSDVEVKVLKDPDVKSWQTYDELGEYRARIQFAGEEASLWLSFHDDKLSWFNLSATAEEHTPIAVERLAKKVRKYFNTVFETKPSLLPKSFAEDPAVQRWASARGRVDLQASGSIFIVGTSPSRLRLNKQKKAGRGAFKFVWKKLKWDQTPQEVSKAMRKSGVKTRDAFSAFQKELFDGADEYKSDKVSLGGRAVDVTYSFFGKKLRKIELIYRDDYGSYQGRVKAHNEITNVLTKKYGEPYFVGRRLLSNEEAQFSKWETTTSQIILARNDLHKKKLVLEYISKLPVQSHKAKAQDSVIGY